MLTGSNLSYNLVPNRMLSSAVVDVDCGNTWLMPSAHAFLITLVAWMRLLSAYAVGRHIAKLLSSLLKDEIGVYERKT